MGGKCGVEALNKADVCSQRFMHNILSLNATAEKMHLKNFNRLRLLTGRDQLYKTCRGPRLWRTCCIG